MDFLQQVTRTRFQSNSVINSLPKNIINEILTVINEEINIKIRTYRQQMLTYAQEIDTSLISCRNSRNKYYQICQQLTSKYSKLKKKYEHLYTRYQSYKARNRELFNLLQFLSSEDIRIQHQILKYQSSLIKNKLNKHHPKAKTTSNINYIYKINNKVINTKSYNPFSKYNNKVNVPRNRSQSQSHSQTQMQMQMQIQTQTQSTSQSPSQSQSQSNYTDDVVVTNDDDDDVVGLLSFRNSIFEEERYSFSNSSNNVTMSHNPLYRDNIHNTHSECIDINDNSNNLQQSSSSNSNSNSSTIKSIKNNAKNTKNQLKKQPNYSLNSRSKNVSNHSSILSVFTDNNNDDAVNDVVVDVNNDNKLNSETQKIYYQQLKLTPVPKKKTIDKNRLIDILQNLPNNCNTNGINDNENDDQHQRCISSQISFPDIDQIKMKHNKSNINSDNMMDPNDDSDADDVDDNDNDDDSVNSSGCSDNDNDSDDSDSDGDNDDIDDHSDDDSDDDDACSDTCNDNDNKNDLIKLFYKFGSQSQSSPALHSFMIDRSSTISSLRKTILSLLQNVPCCSVQLTHSSILLDNNLNNYTLNECNIFEYDTIYVTNNYNRHISRPVSMRANNNDNNNNNNHNHNLHHVKSQYLSSHNDNINHSTSLELRRNLSRSLDVRLDDITKNDNNNNNNNKSDLKTYSPLLLRRKTKKITKTPLILKQIQNQNQNQNLHKIKKKNQNKSKSDITTHVTFKKNVKKIKRTFKSNDIIYNPQQLERDVSREEKDNNNIYKKEYQPINTNTNYTISPIMKQKQRRKTIEIPNTPIIFD